MISKTLDSNFYSHFIYLHQQLEYLASIFEHIHIDTPSLTDLLSKSKASDNYKMVIFNLEKFSE